jgi:hypothetical protein
MRNVKVMLAVGIALMVAVGALTLTRSPPRVVGVGEPGGVAGTSILHTVTGDIAVCQANEVLPGGVSGIRISMWAFFGSQVRVIAYSGSQVLTEGRRGAGWTSDSVTVPVRPVDHATSHVKLCFALGPNSEPVILFGRPASARRKAVILRSGTPAAQVPASDEQALDGGIGIEYLAAGRGPWWSRALSVARQMGLGRAFSGTWIALFLAALMAAVGLLSLRLTLRELP